MDPKETLKQAEEAIKDGDFEQAKELLKYYSEWRVKGGFGSAKQDNKAIQLLSRCRLK
jgi:hypothetical protein